MVIYLWHPVHGTKVASLEEEAKSDEKNGWARFELEKKEAPSGSDANALGKKRPTLSRAK